MMRVRFNVEEMAKKLGVSTKEVLESLQALKESLKMQEQMLIDHAKDGDKISRHFALVGLAWIHCETVREG